MTHRSWRQSRIPEPNVLSVCALGPPSHTSPLSQRDEPFIDDGARVLAISDPDELERRQQQGGALPSFERAGPRAELYFEPRRTRCAIVTCGGLCPGQNDVIRSLYLTLLYSYGIERVLGYRYGYAGLREQPPEPPLELTLDLVRNIHHQGGTVLSSSRGATDVSEMVDTLVRDRIDVLFTIGGDGTLRGAHALVEEIERRGLSIGVVGIPKTIDNDLMWIESSFGFATAVDEARRVVLGAHAEALGAYNGIGLVKLMGRHSGFIAAHATLANSDVNFCLVPEAPFSLASEEGLLPSLEKRLLRRRHAVIVVAEGACQELLRRDGDVERDASGNAKLQDVGVFLRERIEAYFHAREMPVTIKYIDPSYTVRSLTANSLDSELCLLLGQHAVHAAMAGKTDMLVGHWNQVFTHVPLPMATSERKQLAPEGDIWRAVLATTGQGALGGSQ